MRKKTVFVLLIVMTMAAVTVGCGSGSSGKEFGWYSASVPEGYSIDEYGEEFVKKDEGESLLEYKIKVYLYDSGYGTAEQRFANELTDTRYTDAGEKKIGNYTWKRATFKWDNDLESVKYYTQIDKEYFVEIDSFNLGLDDEGVQSFIKSFKVLDGDCEENKYALYNELNKKNN